MATEVYLMEEHEDILTESDSLDEWKEMIEKTGLVGQQHILGESKSPVPFPPMTTEMLGVYGCICPNREKVENYSVSTIPLKVLSLIALSKEQAYFHKIEVWYDVQKPDPIAVGYIKNQNQFWGDGTAYIIARWGDELESFFELKQKAIKRYRDEVLSEVKKRISRLTNETEACIELGITKNLSITELLSRVELARDF